MSTSVGSSRSGPEKIATMTGGAQDTNGPKKGIAMSTPDAAVVTAMKRSPRSRLVPGRSPRRRSR